ncbi:MAG: hypothetical protein HXS46_06125 [Theionarchaea archaeon]|nr:MAG: hypothetical protein AYK18_12065 [Theionarchaea archaeon DG-70]MBU7010249.1 hypothetical protein [Theionarchaea archaeon]
MNLPRGTLKSIEKWEHTRPIDYLAKARLQISGVIRFFERGTAWDVFFLLIENGSLIGYYNTRGDSSLEEKLQSVIEGFEVEVRAFTSTEMEIARTLNAEYLLAEPMKISDVVEGEETELKMGNFFPDASFLAEIKKAKQFREEFHRRRLGEERS